MKLTKSVIRQLVKQQLTEASIGQIKVDKPIRDLVSSLNAAKKATGDLFQQVSDPKAEKQAEWVLKALNTILKNLDHMPELTQDPWYGRDR